MTLPSPFFTGRTSSSVASALTEAKRSLEQKTEVGAAPIFLAKIPRGEVTYARALTAEDPVPFGRPRRARGAKAAGLRYQHKIEGWADRGGLGAGRVLVGPWFQYSDFASDRNFCQPDLLVDRGDGEGIICEIKLGWTADAWWQLAKLYAPVVRAAWGWRSPVLLCVCRSFDPAIPTPEPVEVVQEIRAARPGVVSVLLVR